MKPRSLAKYVHDYFTVEYGSKTFNLIYDNCLKYLIRAINASEFHKRLKRISDKSIKDFRLGLVEDGYYILNVKLFVIHGCAFKRQKSWDTEQVMVDMGIRRKDRPYLAGILYDKELCNHVNVISSQLGGKQNIPSIEQQKALCAEVLQLADEKFQPLFNKLVWSKLRFLIQSGSIDADSVTCDLKARMVQQFYLLSPYRKESVNHWVMTLIKPIQNFALNIIEFHTTQKRARMYEDQGAYKVLDTSIDNLEKEVDKYLEFSDQHTTRINLETKISLNQVVERYGITAKRSRAIKLMTGTYDHEFTEWLKVNGYLLRKSNADNTDFQEECEGTIFLKVVAKFVKIKWIHFRELIAKMRYALTKSTANYYEADRGGYYEPRCTAA